jgi:hypothetical protein
VINTEHSDKLFFLVNVKDDSMRMKNTLTKFNLKFVRFWNHGTAPWQLFERQNGGYQFTKPPFGGSGFLIHMLDEINIFLSVFERLSL